MMVPPWFGGRGLGKTLIANVEGRMIANVEEDDVVSRMRRVTQYSYCGLALWLVR